MPLEPIGLVRSQALRLEASDCCCLSFKLERAPLKTTEILPVTSLFVPWFLRW